MGRAVKRFWALAARDWPPDFPTHQLATAIGAACLTSLLAAGVLQTEAIQPWSTVPCTLCRRDARVVYLARGAVAVCTGDEECPEEELGPTPSWSGMDAEHFVGRLAAALSLDGAPGRPGDVVALGRRKIGDETVAVDLCPHPNEPAALDALARAVRGGPAVRIVLVPDSRRLRADMPSELAGVELVWAGLNEVVSTDGGLRVDLAPITSRRAFRGFVDPRFEGLLVDANGVHWRGVLAVDAQRQQAIALLRALAARPGELVTWRNLRRKVWPLDHSDKGVLGRGLSPDKMDARLRIVVSEVRGALDDLGWDGLVQNQPGDEDKGGYRLLLPAERIRVL